LTLPDIKGIGATALDLVSNKVYAQSVVDSPTVSSLSMNGSSGGQTFNINVSGGISTSAEIGQAVVNALRAYNRAAGPASISTAAYL
jgi:hypothetical protein